MRTKIKKITTTYVVRCPTELWNEAKDSINKNTTINEWLVKLIRKWVAEKNAEHGVEKEEHDVETDEPR